MSKSQDAFAENFLPKSFAENFFAEILTAMNLIKFYLIKQTFLSARIPYLVTTFDYSGQTQL